MVPALSLSERVLAEGEVVGSNPIGGSSELLRRSKA